VLAAVVQGCPDSPRVAAETQEHPEGAITAAWLLRRGSSGGRKMHRYFCSSKTTTKILLAEEQWIKPTHRGREVEQSRGPSGDISSILCHLCSCRQMQGQGTPAVGDKEVTAIAAITPCLAWLPRPHQPLQFGNTQTELCMQTKSAQSRFSVQTNPAYAVKLL